MTGHRCGLGHRVMTRAQAVREAEWQTGTSGVPHRPAPCRGCGHWRIAIDLTDAVVVPVEVTR